MESFVRFCPRCQRGPLELTDMNSTNIVCKACGKKLPTSEIEEMNEDPAGILFGEIGGFAKVQKKIIGEWRHGNEVEAVFESMETGKFYLIAFKESCKDNASFWDMNLDVKFIEVERKTRLIEEVYFEPIEEEEEE